MPMFSALSFSVRPLNTGRPNPAARYVEYIMRAPDGSGRTIVIMRAYKQSFSGALREHGPGIHHVAYQVNSIGCDGGDVCAGAEFQPRRLTNPRSGLKRVFLKVPGAGYTIELIERGDGVESEVFQDKNMTSLVRVLQIQASTSRGRLMIANIDTVRTFLRISHG